MGSQKQLGTNLRKIREKNGLTQAQVAEKANIHVNFYARIERGEENPSYETLEKIAKALKTKSSEMFPF
jgi:transcriptional regulator with XRE-family HTH domain